MMFDADLLMKEEPLHRDLVDHVRRTSFGEMVHHPLVITTLPMGLKRCATVNALYEQKLCQLGEAALANNFHRLVMLYERPYRFEGLTKSIAHGLPLGTPQYWELVGEVWRDSENIRENRKGWSDIWLGNASNRHHAMTESDREVFSGLRNRFRIYRGDMFWNPDHGWSWTLSRAKAIWFAHRFTEKDGLANRGGFVHTAYVEKADVLAYFGSRDEKEIVVDPSKLSKPEYVTI
jgi:hypothetical protein